MASSKSSSLKLLIQQGPRQGETLEFKSRSGVRIGRVVKGNNLTIKDFGISSKHLIIEFKPESGNWEIKDLDSSNGTILNSSQLKPFSPSVIRNGDEIKIGELTSIRLEILPIEEATNIRRSTRNRKAAVDLGENSRVGDLNVDSSMVEEIPKRRGRGRPKKVGNIEDEHAENLEDIKLKPECGVMSKRNTRSSKRREFVLDLEHVTQPRRTRRANNAEGVMPISVMEESEGLDDCKQVVQSNKTRGARGRKKKPSIRSLDNVLDVFPEEKMNNQDVLEKEVPQQESCEYFKDDKTNEQVLQLSVSELGGGDPCLKEKNSAEALVEITQQDNDLCGIESDATLHDRRMEETEAAQDVLEEIMNREVLWRKLPEQVVKPCEIWMNATKRNVLDDKTNAQFLEGMILDQDGGAHCVREQDWAEEGAQQDGSLVDVSHAEERVCNGVESDVFLNDGRVEESDVEEIVKESEFKCCDRSKDPEAINVPNLENMTLGEWFDYLEVYLPKQIHAATDEIIKDMQKRAKQFDEFMLQHQKEKKTAFGFGKDDDLN